MLVDEIIELSVDDAQPASKLLRKALVLAYQLDNTLLKSWAESELNGYEETSGLPSYRRLAAGSKGTFSGPFGAGVKNQPLPANLMDKEHREFTSFINLTQPLIAYESIGKQEGNPIISWPHDLIHYYQGRFMQGFALVSAWQVVPHSAIVSIPESVRNRLLQLSLKLKSDVTSGSLGDIKDIPRLKVSQSVNNYIYGGNVVIAGSARQFTQNSTAINPNDFEALKAKLSTANVPSEELETLKTSLDEDRQASEVGIGPRTHSWLSRISKLGSTIATDVVAQAISQYLGLN